MPHFMIVMIQLIPSINLLNLSWIIKCLFLRNMEPLIHLFTRVVQGRTYSTAQVKEPIFFFISRINFTIRDFPPSGLE